MSDSSHITRSSAPDGGEQIRRNKKKFWSFFDLRSFEPLPNKVQPQSSNQPAALLLPSQASLPNASVPRSTTPTPATPIPKSSLPPQPGNNIIFSDVRASLRDVIGLLPGDKSTLKLVIPTEMKELHDNCIALFGLLEQPPSSDQQSLTRYNEIAAKMKQDLTEMERLLRRWSEKSFIREQLGYNDIHVQVKIMQDQFSRHLQMFNVRPNQAMRQDETASATATLTKIVKEMQGQPSPPVSNQVQQADNDTINQQVLAFTGHSPDASYILKGVIGAYDKSAQHHGDIFNVYKGWLKESGQVIALKMYRETHHNDSRGIRVVERILRQVQLWTSFSHPFILPCLGMGMQVTKVSAEEEAYDEFQLYLVSPWTKNRDAVRFFRKLKQPLSPIAILRYIQQTAAGIQYLHTHKPPCVHANIRGENIIIKDDNTACLNGFGSTKAHYGDQQIALTGNKFGIRWMAPELLVGDEPPLLPSCDIWSWSMTILELMSGAEPYHNHKQDWTIRKEIRKGTKPQQSDYPMFNERCPQPSLMWALLEKCWAREPADRPSIHGVVVELEMIETIQLQEQAVPHIFM